MRKKNFMFHGSFAPYSVFNRLERLQFKFSKPSIRFTLYGHWKKKQTTRPTLNNNFCMSYTTENTIMHRTPNMMTIDDIVINIFNCTTLQMFRSDVRLLIYWLFFSTYKYRKRSTENTQSSLFNNNKRVSFPLQYCCWFFFSLFSCPFLSLLSNS